QVLASTRARMATKSGLDCARACAEPLHSSYILPWHSAQRTAGYSATARTGAGVASTSANASAREELFCVHATATRSRPAPSARMGALRVSLVAAVGSAVLAQMAPHYLARAEVDGHLCGAACADRDLAPVLVAVGLPGYDRIGAFGHVVDAKPTVGSGDRVVAAVEHFDLGHHLGMDVAVHIHDARLGQCHRLGGSALVQAEVEPGHSRNREHVVEHLVFVRELHFFALLHHGQVGDEGLVALPDLRS